MSSSWSLQGFELINTVAVEMLFIVARLQTALRLGILAALLCAMNGCGGPSHDIIGKWRTADQRMVWEFSNGSVVWQR